MKNKFTNATESQKDVETTMQCLLQNLGSGGICHPTNAPCPACVKGTARPKQREERAECA
eukprot:395741-Pyramimonas_sp.AAC.1